MVTGSVHQRKRDHGTNKRVIILNFGFKEANGKRTPDHRWVPFVGTEREAEVKKAELVTAANKGEYVNPTDLTLNQHLSRWFTVAIEGKRRQSTIKRYRQVLALIATHRIGSLRVQDLQSDDLELDFYVTIPLSGASKALCHAVISKALRAAAKSKIVPRNVAYDVEDKPKAPKPTGDQELERCWEPETVATFLETTDQEDPQTAAAYRLLLETGIRQSEFMGLKWTHLRDQQLSVHHQLVRTGKGQWTFGPTKSGSSRPIDLSPELVQFLHAHRRTQRELKLRLGSAYHDHGLMFAKQELGQRKRPGDPLDATMLYEDFHRLCDKAGVRRITFHGMRHTMATTMLLAGEPVNVVQRRLGHADPQITLRVYAHVLPSMQQGAALRINSLYKRVSQKLANDEADE